MNHIETKRLDRTCKSFRVVPVVSVLYGLNKPAVGKTTVAVAL